METIKIHYLGKGVHELHKGATLKDAIYSLGAKYGAQLYNKGIQTKAIRILEDDNTILIRVNQMDQLEKQLN